MSITLAVCATVLVVVAVLAYLGRVSHINTDTPDRDTFAAIVLLVLALVLYGLAVGLHVAPVLTPRA